MTTPIERGAEAVYHGFDHVNTLTAIPITRAVFESIDVDELARAVDPAVYTYLNRVTGKEWEACVKVATAIKAHLLGGDRG